MTQIATFDTYKIIKRLESKGASTDLAQEIVQAIQEGRTLELSALVSKNDFYDFKDEFHEFKESIYNFRDETKERFSKLESEIKLIRKDIDLKTSQVESKLIKWMIGLLSPLYVGTLVIIVRFFITGN